MRQVQLLAHPSLPVISILVMFLVFTFAVDSVMGSSSMMGRNYEYWQGLAMVTTVGVPVFGVVTFVCLMAALIANRIDPFSRVNFTLLWIWPSVAITSLLGYFLLKALMFVSNVNTRDLQCYPCWPL